MHTASKTSRRDDPYRAAQLLIADKRYREAFEIYLGLANNGEPTAQVHVGWMCFEGIGVARDTEQALSWFQRAASLGSPSGAFYCGRAAGTRGNWEEALAWFRQAAQSEYGPALLWLGLAFLKGYGVAIDLNKAIVYLERSSSVGNYYARRELALLMISGKCGISRIPSGILLLLSGAVAAIIQFLRGQSDDRLVG